MQDSLESSVRELRHDPDLSPARKAARVEPLGARVLVLPILEDDVTTGGIVLPETVRERPQKGRVVAAGPGDWVEGRIALRREMDVRAGDVVHFARYAGTELKIGGVEHLVVRAEDLLAVERTP